MSTNNPTPSTLTETTFTVKNRAVAEKQMTLEQLMHDAQSFIEVEIEGTFKTFHDEAEVTLYKASKRQDFQQNVKGRGKAALGAYVRFARWEATMKEFDRAREVFEQAIGIDPHNLDLWLHYINMELSHGAVQSARNLYHQATKTMPGQYKLWYKWLELEEKLSNVDNVRQIYSQMSQTRYETGVLPPSDVFDQYVAFELKYKQFQNVLNIYEQFLIAYPIPETYMKYAEFALYNGHLVDISAIYPTSRAEVRKGPNFDNLDDDSQNDTIDTSGNAFLSTYHKNLRTKTTKTSRSANPFAKPPLTPRIIFERAITELKIVPTLQQQVKFDALHYHFLLSQLELSNAPAANSTSTALTVVQPAPSPNPPSTSSQLPPIKSQSDLIALHKLLQNMLCPDLKTVSSMVNLLLKWSEIEEENLKRRFFSNARITSHHSTDTNPEHSNSNSSSNSSSDFASLIQKPREVLYFAFQITPLRYHNQVLQALLSFEKRYGDTTMLDLALLQITRLKYKESLSISYTSFLQLFGMESMHKFDKKGNALKSSNITTSEPVITTINGVKQITIPSFTAEHINTLQSLVRDYDVWLEWAKVEQKYVTEQVELYCLYNGINLESLIRKKQHREAKMKSNQGNHMDLTTDDLVEDIQPVPPALSYLHADVETVYQTAQRFVPIMHVTQTPSPPSPPLPSHQTQSSPPHPHYTISTQKHDWKRYIYLFINHSLYQELFMGDIEKAKQTYLLCLKTTPSTHFTFSCLWSNLALLEVRRHVSNFQTILHNARSGGLTDFLSSPSTSTSLSTSTTDANRPTLPGQKYYSAAELDKIERDLFQTTVTDVRAIFGRGVGIVKQLLAKLKKQPRQQQQQQHPQLRAIFSQEQAAEQKQHRLNIKLFKSYLAFEQSIHSFTRIRDLYNDFLTSFSSNYQLWSSYIMFETIQSQIDRARGLLHISLGLNRIFASTAQHQLPHLYPLIQCVVNKQLSYGDQSSEISPLGQSIINLLPLHKQLAPTINPLVPAADINTLWELYLEVEKHEFDEESQLPHLSKQFITNQSVMNYFDTQKPFTQHPTFNFTSMIPYLTQLLPDLYHICTAHELWIITNPLTFHPYLHYINFWGRLSTQFHLDDQQQANKRPLDSGFKLVDLLTIDFNQLYSSTIEASPYNVNPQSPHLSPSTTSPAALQPFTQSKSLRDYCVMLGRYVLAVFHYRVIKEVKLLDNILDQFKIQINRVGAEINQLDISSVEEVEMLDEQELEDYDAQRDAKLREIDAKISTLADELYQLMIAFDSHLAQSCQLKLLRETALKSLFQYERTFGNSATQEESKHLLPHHHTKVAKIMYPKSDAKRQTDQSIQDTTQDHFEQTIQKTTLILQQRWVIENKSYDELTFPQDEVKQKAKVSRLLAKAKQLKSQQATGGPAAKISPQSSTTTTIPPATLPSLHHTLISSNQDDQHMPDLEVQHSDPQQLVSLSSSAQQIQPQDPSIQ